MLGPYEAQPDGTIRYRGNKVWGPIEDVRNLKVPLDRFRQRVDTLRHDVTFRHLSWVNHRINLVTHDFFTKRGALFTLLPLTTRMISSPGALYGKGAIDYSTDASPIALQWFDLPAPAFLSESSQIYLELALAQPGVDEVYSVYNSFRLERSDFAHLAEFHHIEFEGKIDREENEGVVLGLIGRIVDDLLANAEESLSHFLPPRWLGELASVVSTGVTRLTFAEALEILYKDTRNSVYREFTMDGTFSAWEEIRLTQIVGGLVLVREFPLLEVAFYHAQVGEKDPCVAKNTDFIWPGYREIVGAGERISSIRELDAKARLFRLPLEDYAPYLQTRQLPGWQRSSGFGLGWERLLHGLLGLPAIWDACHFPRTHAGLVP